jgi:uncharacterized protein
MLLANGVLLVSVMHYRRMTYRDLFHSSKSSVSATLILLVPPVLLLVPLVLLLQQGLMVFVYQLLPISVWEQQAFANMLAGSLPAVLATCVLAPVLEEMLFRGVLLRAFLNQYGRWEAIAYSALFFGVAHLNVYQFLLAFSLGLLLGWLFERSRSLIPCIAMHAAFNTSVVALQLGKEQGSESRIHEMAVSAWPLALAAAAIGAIVLRRIFVRSSRTAADVV